MKKIVIIGLLLFFAVPCHCMDWREQQIRRQSHGIKNALWLNTAASTAGIFYWSCSRTNRVLNEYARELPRYFSNFAGNKTLDPLRMVMPYWSSRFASFLKKMRMPESLVEKLKPMVASRICRYPLAASAGLITAVSFYKIARATNFFGLKTILHKITGLKHDKHWLKIDKAEMNRNARLAAEGKDYQIRDKNTRIADLEGQLQRLQSENNRLSEAATDHIVRETRQDGEIRRLTMQIGTAKNQLSDFERQQIMTNEQSRIKTLKTFYLFSIITDLIKDDPSKYPDQVVYQAIVLELLEAWCKDRKSDEPIPEAFKLSLAIIDSLPVKMKQETILKVCELLIPYSLNSSDESIFKLMKTNDISLHQVSQKSIAHIQTKPQLLQHFIRDKDTCPVCMETFANKTAKTTICGHLFCDHCYQECAQETCPLCRRRQSL